MPHSGPLLAPAPAFSQWTITFSYPDDAAAKGTAGSSTAATPVPAYEASRPKTVITTKTGDIIHEETSTLDGSKTEDWQVHGNYYTKYPGKNYWSAYEKTDTSLGTIRTLGMLLLPDSGFPGLDWVGKDTYAGKIKTSSGENLVFVPGGVNTVNADNPAEQNKLQSLPTVAYIDAETRLPVTVRVPGETREFTFAQNPPSSMQVLPADLADEIKKGDAIRAKRNGIPQREY